jgi:hypothetical protein
MAPGHVVVDGSNIATEGRSTPSLAQLRDAVAAYRTEFPDDQVTVVVDASFAYRIEEPERPAFEEAEAAGEMISPPAGAIGRGDGFLLQIADRTDAAVLSNDSFQEFHGEYEWLFERGRLIGGKPVPGVGWIFLLRSPVRGPRSRQAQQEAKRQEAKKQARPRAKPVEQAIAEATEDVLEPGSARASRRRRRTKAPPPEAVNDPLTFITFLANHPLGSEVEGEVDRFASHGAFVTLDGAVCYVPLTAMGEPPPRSARSVLHRGDRRQFVVQAFDAPRRGIELAFPGFAHVAAEPTPETVEAETAAARKAAPKKAPRRKKTEPKMTAKRAAPKKVPAKKVATKTAAIKTKAAPKKAAAKKAAAMKKTVATKKAAKKKAAASTRKAAPRKGL